MTSSANSDPNVRSLPAPDEETDQQRVAALILMNERYMKTLQNIAHDNVQNMIKTSRIISELKRELKGLVDESARDSH